MKLECRVWRDWDAFNRWFKWNFRSVVVDPHDDPLLQREI
jgi:hypothetical protein